MAELACSECSAPLQVQYRSKGDQTGPGAPTPLRDERAAITLGEGDTPSVRLRSVGQLLGIRNLYGKLELTNPTGSFKDRGSSVMVSVAREQGVLELVEDSSGNAGASVAAYAARAGIRAQIFAPASASEAKLRQIRAYGADVHQIEGSREDTATAAVDYCRVHALPYASHAVSPYFLEGTKTFAYEVVLDSEQTGELPSHIVFPVGNGGLLLGAWIGLKELQQAGRLKQMPRLHAVQAFAVSPIASAYAEKAWSAEPGTSTVAGGIAVGAPARKEQVLDALRDTHGVAVSVEDSEMLRWRGLLAEKEGIFAEPTSAAAFAGVERLVAMGVIGAEEVVLAPVTGSGLKDDTPV